MKRQLNTICILMFLCIGLMLAPSVYLLYTCFVEGFEYGLEQAEDAQKSGVKDISANVLLPVELNLWPQSLSVSPDKVYNKKTEEWLPAQHLRSLLWVKSGKGNYSQGWMSLFSILGLVAVILAVFIFYKLINAINHQVIFEWINVRRLNRIGIALLVSFFMLQISWLINFLTVKNMIQLEGYEFNFFGEFKAIHLLLALVSLLVGRIFAMGITLREEQELTI